MKKLAFREGLVSFKNVDVTVVRKCRQLYKGFIFQDFEAKT